MRHYSISDLADRLVTYGRTFREPEEDILYFNWSGSTVEFMRPIPGGPKHGAGI